MGPTNCLLQGNLNIKERDWNMLLHLLMEITRQKKDLPLTIYKIKKNFQSGICIRCTILKAECGFNQIISVSILCLFGERKSIVFDSLKFK